MPSAFHDHHSKYPSISMKCNDHNFQMRKVQLQRGFCEWPQATVSWVRTWASCATWVGTEEQVGGLKDPALSVLFPPFCSPLSCPIVSSHYRKAGLHSCLHPSLNSASYLRNVTCSQPFPGTLHPWKEPPAERGGCEWAWLAGVVLYAVFPGKKLIDSGQEKERALTRWQGCSKSLWMLPSAESHFCHRGGLGEEIPFSTNKKNSNAWSKWKAVFTFTMRGRTDKDPNSPSCLIPVYRVVGQQATKCRRNNNWNRCMATYNLKRIGSRSGLWLRKAPYCGVWNGECGLTVSELWAGVCAVLARTTSLSDSLGSRVF